MNVLFRHECFCQSHLEDAVITFPPNSGSAVAFQDGKASKAVLEGAPSEQRERGLEVQEAM